MKSKNKQQTLKLKGSGHYYFFIFSFDISTLDNRLTLTYLANRHFVDRAPSGCTKLIHLTAILDPANAKKWASTACSRVVFIIVNYRVSREGLFAFSSSGLFCNC